MHHSAWLHGLQLSHVGKLFVLFQIIKSSVCTDDQPLLITIVADLTPTFNMVNSSFKAIKTRN